jgi:hypothetical protein
VNTMSPGPIADVDAVMVVTIPLAGVECAIILLDCGELALPKSAAGNIGFAVDDVWGDDTEGSGNLVDLPLGGILTGYMRRKGKCMRSRDC